MSIIPSLNTIISLLSFLTVIFALVRVGAAAFSANQSSQDRSSRGDGKHHHSRTWQLSKAAAAPAAHLLQLQLGGPGGSANPSGFGSGPGGNPPGGMSMSMPSFMRFGPSSDFAQAIRFGLATSEKQKGSGSETDQGEYIAGNELVRMPASTWTGMRRPGLLFRPPSPYPDQTKPLSMAKLIMSRHQNPRRTNRPPIARRPPGLPALPSARSRLVEEV